MAAYHFDATKAIADDGDRRRRHNLSVCVEGRQEWPPDADYKAMFGDVGLVFREPISSGNPKAGRVVTEIYLTREQAHEMIDCVLNSLADLADAEATGKLDNAD